MTLFTSYGVYEVICLDTAVAFFPDVFNLLLSVNSWLTYSSLRIRTVVVLWSHTHTSPPRCYRAGFKGFKVNIMGLSGKRMSSKVLCTSTWRCFSTLKFSSICRDMRCSFMPWNHRTWWKVSVCLTWMRKICISASAILRPKHWRGPKPKPRLLKYCVSVLSQRDGWYCSGRKNTFGSLPIAYRPNWTRV